MKKKALVISSSRPELYSLIMDLLNDMNEEVIPMWVQAKERVRFKVDLPDCRVSYAVQQGSKWIARFEPGIEPDLPWRIEHDHANIRMSEKRFLELFEPVNPKTKNDLEW